MEGLRSDATGAKSELSQPGGLRATEGQQITKPSGKKTKPTHPLTKHGPNVSDITLKNRVKTELVDKGKTGRRTRFNNQAEMEASIARIKRMRRVEIETWLKSNPPAGAVRAFSGNPGMGNLGTGFEVATVGGPITKISGPMENVNPVLISDGSGGYLIHPAHPF